MAAQRGLALGAGVGLGLDVIRQVLQHLDGEGCVSAAKLLLGLAGTDGTVLLVSQANAAVNALFDAVDVVEKVRDRSVDAPPFADGGIGPKMAGFCFISSSPRGTLDGLVIEAPRGISANHHTCGVGIWAGGLRLQSCGGISAPKESDRPFLIPYLHFPLDCQDGDTSIIRVSSLVPS